MTVKLEEAETTLAQLVRRALGGEEVILAQDDETEVELVPVSVANPAGQAAGIGSTGR